MTPSETAAFVEKALAEQADPQRAVEMAAYMKAPPESFLGVPQPARKEIEKALWRKLSITSAEEYTAQVLALWQRPHRETRYLAIELARRFHRFIRPEALSLYERLVREGAWWDFVDPVAARLVGGAWQRDRAAVEPVMDRWIEDPCLWIRRTAILGQLGHKTETDEARLFDYCLRRADEKEFFIRKAIGWALREHGKTAPGAVRGFLLENQGRLSGLSFREGGRILEKQGLL